MKGGRSAERRADPSIMESLRHRPTSVVRVGIIQRMSRRRRITIIALITGVVLVAAVAIFSVAAVTVPGTCEVCHRISAISPGAGDKAHSGVTCLQCHADAGIADRAELAAAVPLMVIASAPEGVSQVSRGACLKCHPYVGKDVTEAGGLRIDHRSCVSLGAGCGSCHDRKIHGLQGSGKLQWERSLGMEECVSCHERESAPQECTTCHDGKMQRDRLTSGIWQLTHGPDWEQKHGLGGTRMCTACHQRTDCAKCHGIELPHKPQFSTSHGADSVAHAKSCATCHDESFCSGCHGIEMPHPASFMPRHKSIVEKQGDTGCYGCHAQRDCRVCHNRHIHPGWADRAGKKDGVEQ